jgi:SMC interacting uncharacterized protein involved in chromosome segregation
MSRTATTPDVQPIDRLEEKVRQLVGMIDRLRADHARAADEIARLQRELDTAHAQLSDASTTSAELTTLRDERELIRDRVVQMISQIDKLNL